MQHRALRNLCFFIQIFRRFFVYFSDVDLRPLEMRIFSYAVASKFQRIFYWKRVCDRRPKQPHSRQARAVLPAFPRRVMPRAELKPLNLESSIGHVGSLQILLQ